MVWVANDTTVEIRDKDTGETLFTFSPKPKKITKQIIPEWRIRRSKDPKYYPLAVWRRKIVVRITLEGKLNPYKRSELESVLTWGSAYDLQYPLQGEVNADLVILKDARFTLEEAKKWDTDQNASPTISYILQFEKVSSQK